MFHLVLSIRRWLDSLRSQIHGWDELQRIIIIADTDSDYTLLREVVLRSGVFPYEAPPFLSGEKVNVLKLCKQWDAELVNSLQDKYPPQTKNVAAAKFYKGCFL